MIFELVIILFKCSPYLKKICNEIRQEKLYYFVEVDCDIPENREEVFFNVMKPHFIICEELTEYITNLSVRFNVKLIAKRHSSFYLV